MGKFTVSSVHSSTSKILNLIANITLLLNQLHNLREKNKTMIVAQTVPDELHAEVQYLTYAQLSQQTALKHTRKKLQVYRNDVIPVIRDRLCPHRQVDSALVLYMSHSCEYLARISTLRSPYTVTDIFLKSLEVEVCNFLLSQLNMQR